MALSIKNKKAEELASQLAQETDETMTDAVIHALEDRLQKVRGKKSLNDTLERILEISERCASFPDLDSRSPEEILNYNSEGTF